MKNEVHKMAQAMNRQAVQKWEAATDDRKYQLLHVLKESYRHACHEIDHTLFPTDCSPEYLLQMVALKQSLGHFKRYLQRSGQARFLPLLPA